MQTKRIPSHGSLTDMNNNGWGIGEIERIIGWDSGLFLDLAIYETVTSRGQSNAPHTMEHPDHLLLAMSL